MQGIERRDGGVKADPAELFLTNGASQAVHFLTRLLIRDESDALLVPIPQYPLVAYPFSACIVFNTVGVK